MSRKRTAISMVAIIACNVFWTLNAEAEGPGWKKLKGGNVSAAQNLFQSRMSDQSISVEEKIYVLWGLAITNLELKEYSTATDLFEESQNLLKKHQLSRTYSEALSKIRSEKPDVYRKIIQQQKANRLAWEKGYTLSLYRHSAELLNNKNWQGSIRNLSILSTFPSSGFSDVPTLLDSSYYGNARVALGNNKFNTAVQNLEKITDNSSFGERRVSLYDSLYIRWGDFHIGDEEWALALEKYALVSVDSPLHIRGQVGMGNAIHHLGIEAYRNGNYTEALSFFEKELNSLRYSETGMDSLSLHKDADITVYIDSTKYKIQTQQFEEALESKNYVLMERFIATFPSSAQAETLNPVYFAALLREANAQMKKNQWAKVQQLLEKIPSSSPLYSEAQKKQKTAEVSLFAQTIKKKGVKSVSAGNRHIKGTWVAEIRIGDDVIHFKYLFQNDNTFISWTSENIDNWGPADITGTWEIKPAPINGNGEDIEAELGWSAEPRNLTAKFRFNKNNLEMYDEFGDFQGLLIKR